MPKPRKRKQPTRRHSITQNKAGLTHTTEIRPDTDPGYRLDRYWDEPTEAELAELDQEQLVLWDSLFRTDGPEMDFVVERGADVQARDGEHAGISNEAMVDLDRKMMMWIGTRMMRYYALTDLMAQRVRVKIIVECDGYMAVEDDEVNVQFPARALRRDHPV